MGLPWESAGLIVDAYNDLIWVYLFLHIIDVKAILQIVGFFFWRAVLTILQIWTLLMWIYLIDLTVLLDLIDFEIYIYLLKLLSKTFF